MDWLKTSLTANTVCVSVEDLVMIINNNLWPRFELALLRLWRAAASTLLRHSKNTTHSKLRVKPDYLLVLRTAPLAATRLSYWERRSSTTRTAGRILSSEIIHHFYLNHRRSNLSSLVLLINFIPCFMLSQNRHSSLTKLKLPCRPLALSFRSSLKSTRLQERDRVPLWALPPSHCLLAVNFTTVLHKWGYANCWCILCIKHTTMNAC